MEYILIFNDYVRNVAVFVMVMFLITRLTYFRNLLNQELFRRRNWLVLVGVFGGLAMLGMGMGYFGTGIFMDLSLISVAVGGLLGGPLIGLGVGIVYAIPRFFLGYNGIPGMTAGMMSNIFSGYFSGMVYQLYGKRQITTRDSFFVACALEILYIVISYTFYPYGFKQISDAGFYLILHFLSVVNGVCVCFYIARGTFTTQERLRAQSAQQAMCVILSARGVLRHHGLDRFSAYRLAQILFKEINADAVAIADTEEFLAFVGENDNYKKAKILLRGQKKYNQDIVKNKQDIVCQRMHLCLETVVDLPLRIDDTIVGSVKIYKTSREKIFPYEVRLIEGVVNFLNLELLQTELNQKTTLLMQAEFNSLKSQIRPHFLFNMMANISALIRPNPNKARSLIKDLSDFLRVHLKSSKEEISITEELEYVNIYIRLEQARFGDRITVIKKIAVEALNHKVPTFSMQVLVENAVKHGITKVKKGGIIYITVSHKKDFLQIYVEDNGVGIDPEKLSQLKKMDYIVNNQESTGLGLKNVNARLKKIYGEEYGLQIESLQGAGTKVGFIIPWDIKEEEKKYEIIAGNDR
ncbi:histidine kinase [Megasphaera sueciensis]|jgi:LytS/YehU family sensor histidine kinase|uniref:histidine kinase n=1 Tax=Megasphaera sueciensis TaxID=349094 RepID=UPI003CFD159D